MGQLREGEMDPESPDTLEREAHQTRTEAVTRGLSLFCPYPHPESFKRWHLLFDGGHIIGIKLPSGEQLWGDPPFK